MSFLIVFLTIVAAVGSSVLFYSDSYVAILFLFTETDASSAGADDYWCQVAYRELSEHIGQLFPVAARTIDVFQHVAHGSGISLSALHQHHLPKSDKVQSVRAKIGAGVTLSREGGTVWLYNRSMYAVFVTSYSLNIDNDCADTWRVYKVNSGHAISVYDDEIMARWTPRLQPEDGPIDSKSIHISFVKGWGRDYRRQSVLNCACWLEILLNATNS